MRPLRVSALMLPLLLGACADFSPLELLVRARDGVDRIAGGALDKAAGQIDAYCAIPLDERLKLREGLNSRTQRGDISVSCEGDPAPPAPVAAVAPPPVPRPARPPRPAQPAR